MWITRIRSLDSKGFYLLQVIDHLSYSYICQLVLFEAHPKWFRCLSWPSTGNKVFSNFDKISLFSRNGIQLLSNAGSLFVLFVFGALSKQKRNLYWEIWSLGRILFFSLTITNMQYKNICNNKIFIFFLGSR